MLTGVILTGSRKEERDAGYPALLPYRGKLLIHRQIRELRKLCGEIVVVTEDPRPFLPHLDSSVRIITEFVPGKGMLGGMHAAFMLSKYKNVWVVGSDMPYISAKAARLLADVRLQQECDAAVPVIDGIIHPLHGLYHKNCADAVSALLTGGETSIERLFELVYWKQVLASDFRTNGVSLSFVKTVNVPLENQQPLG